MEHIPNALALTKSTARPRVEANSRGGGGLGTEGCGGMSDGPCQSAEDGGALKWGPPSHSQTVLRSRGQGLQGGLRLPREYTKELELKRCFGIGKRGRVCGRGTGEGRGGVV